MKKTSDKTFNKMSKNENWDKNEKNRPVKKQKNKYKNNFIITDEEAYDDEFEEIEEEYYNPDTYLNGYENWEELQSRKAQEFEDDINDYIFDEGMLNGNQQYSVEDDLDEDYFSES